MIIRWQFLHWNIFFMTKILNGTIVKTVDDALLLASSNDFDGYYQRRKQTSYSIIQTTTRK